MPERSMNRAHFNMGRDILHFHSHSIREQCFCTYNVHGSSNMRSECGYRLIRVPRHRSFEYFLMLIVHFKRNRSPRAGKPTVAFGTLKQNLSKPSKPSRRRRRRKRLVKLLVPNFPRIERSVRICLKSFLRPSKTVKASDEVIFPGVIAQLDALS